MSQPISIVHLTDIHIRQKTAHHIERRVEAFVKFARKENLKPDILVFTGDLTFQGSADEFKLFDKTVLKPICAGLGINPKNALLIPGNHDIDRDGVSAREVSEREKRDTASGAESLLISGQAKRLKNFFEYVDSIGASTTFLSKKPIIGGNANVVVTKVHGLRVGIAALNTAWQCADDHDWQRLLLTEGQISEAASQLKGCDLRLALLHHPGEWLHPSEKDLALNDLKREFDIILSGHLHNPESEYRLEPSNQHLWFVGRAFFEGKVEAKVDDGFHHYKVDVENRTVQAFYKRFIRKRDTFDADTDHADKGQHEFPLFLGDRLITSDAIVAQRLAIQGSQLQQEIRQELSLLQDTPNPVIVTPKITRVRFIAGERKTSKQGVSVAELLEGNAVLFGPQDSGKSILLKSIAAEHQMDCTNRSILPAGELVPTHYFKISSIAGVSDVKSLESAVLSSLDKALVSNENIKLRLLIDDVKRDVQQTISLVHDLCSLNDWRYIIATNNQLAADALAQEEKCSSTRYFELQPWGPSKIKEMAVRLFEKTGIDAEMAFKCVKRTLADYDLPASPTTISLYFSFIARSRGTVSSVPFLRLLEKIEDNRIGANEKPPANDKYHRRQILFRIVARMLELSSDVISVEVMNVIIEDYYRVPMMGNHSKEAFEDLIKSGLLVREGDNVSFVNFVFMSYFIALGVTDGAISEGLLSKDLNQCVCLVQSLALFAGMKRNNVELAEKVLNWIRDRFPDSDGRNLGDLDLHVKTLLSPEYEDGEVDTLVEKDLARKRDYTNTDDSYAETREIVSKSRKKLFLKKDQLTLDELSAQLGSLHAFYGILKNLDQIDGIRKVEFLDQILDLHIRTNFSLIDFFHSMAPDDDFKSIAAYMLTWSGHKFMAASLGTDALSNAAKAFLTTCKNDFKTLLVIMLLSDMRDPQALKLIKEFATTSESRSGIEILFVHLRQRMVEHEAASIPTELVSVFRSVFERRQRLYSKRSDKRKEGALFDQIMNQTRSQHAAVRQSGLSSPS